MTKTTSKQSEKARDARKSKHHKTIRSTARKPTSPQMTLPRAAVSTSMATNNNERSDTKQARMIAMLRAPAGATIDAMMLAARWQQHSVRGFLAGVVRKKLGLDLLSEAGESGRVYRISDRTASHAAKTRTNKTS